MPRNSNPSQRTKPKRCFLTVGATASFHSLIRTSLSQQFLTALRQHGYRELRIQYGKDGKGTFEDYLWALSSTSDPSDPVKDADLKGKGMNDDVGYEDEEDEDVKKTGKDVDGIVVSGFDFKAEGLSREMVRAREGGGCVVSHAGSGSILDALRIGAPLLVVPNPELMDNHQVELAEVLEEQRYVVHGRLDDLGNGIARVEKLKEAMREWPPVTAGSKGGKKGGLVKVVREEMGWLD